MDERPDLSSLELFYYDAFVFLSPMRNAGMGISAIPISCYSEYYRIFGGPNDLPFFTKVLRDIDGRFINAQHEKDKKESKAKKPRKSR